VIGDGHSEIPKKEVLRLDRASFEFGFWNLMCYPFRNIWSACVVDSVKKTKRPENYVSPFLLELTAVKLWNPMGRNVSVPMATV
jgi:hypothetical protein